MPKGGVREGAGRPIGAVEEEPRRRKPGAPIAERFAKDPTGTYDFHLPDVPLPHAAHVEAEAISDGISTRQYLRNLIKTDYEKAKKPSGSQ